MTHVLNFLVRRRRGRAHRDAREAAMPVRIRLARYGHRNLPFYRIYVADSRAPRDGKHIEIIGHYDPKPGACPWRRPDAAQPARVCLRPSLTPGISPPPSPQRSMGTNTWD